MDFSDQIWETIAEIVRIARKGIISNEFYMAGSVNGLFIGGRWVYDFPSILRRLLPESNIMVKRSMFSGGDWNLYGTLIEVRI